jgi:hypothetical protein
MGDGQQVEVVLMLPPPLATVMAAAVVEVQGSGLSSDCAGIALHCVSKWSLCTSEKGSHQHAQAVDLLQMVRGRLGQVFA